MTVLRARPLAARTHPCRRSAADRGSPIRIRAGAWSVVTIARCTRSRGATSSDADASNRSCARPGSPTYSSHTPSKPRRCPDPKLLPDGSPAARSSMSYQARPSAACACRSKPARAATPASTHAPGPPAPAGAHGRARQVDGRLAAGVGAAPRRKGRHRPAHDDGRRGWAACAQPSGWPSGAAWWPGTSPSTSPSRARPGRLTRLHEARHSCLTFLAMDGVPDTVLAAWAAHTNVGFTKRVYVHPTADDMRSASAQLEALLGFKDGPSRPAV